MNLFSCILTMFKPRTCYSNEFIYNHMESQSGRSLPFIYQTFDAGKRSHWCDRGSCFDYLLATGGEGTRLLDLGPGDGWPSLIVAPYVAEVIGVDGASKRVEICTSNAQRLGITNASFIYNPPESPLPFPDNSFDGIMAASSLEQTPNPYEMLRELHRVLKENGRLRFHYESLGCYAERKEDIWLARLTDDTCALIFFQRNISDEEVVQIALHFSMPAQDIIKFCSGTLPTYSNIELTLLEQLQPFVTDARICRTHHPSTVTWLRWLRELGFCRMTATHNGADFAGRLYDTFTETERPGTMAAIDALLRPLVGIAINLAAPVPEPTDSASPWITAIK